MKKRLSLIVYGVVQGIYFRASVKTKAKQLGLTGWVKNLPNGSVELMAEGEEEKLVELARYCRKGPVDAVVEEVIPEWGVALGQFKTFEILY